MPSAISGNVQGYASSSSPGLVSTAAQTFGGDKTLTGLTTASGGIINTGLTGANATTVTTAGSNKVGEIVDAGTYANTTATLTEADVPSSVSGAYQISLNAGVWLVSYSVSAYYSTATGVGNSGYIIVCITDSANTHIARSERIVVASSGAGGVSTVETSLSCSFVLNVSSNNTVYKMRLKKVDSSGTGTAKVERLSGTYDGNFFAVRIA